jgi:hypothetical protein
MEKSATEKKEYQKPELVEYENLNKITAGSIPSGPV